MSKSTLVTIRLTDSEIEALIGSADTIYNYSADEIVNLMLDGLSTDLNSGKNVVSLHTALMGIAVIFRKHFMEITLQIDKTKLRPDAAMLLASIKGRHQIEEKEL